MPSGSVGDGMQQPPGVVHVVRVTRRHGFPGVPGRVSCRNTERAQQPILAVGAVVSQGLTRPLARDEHPAPGVAEVISVVGLALAGPGGQARAGVLGLDAVAQPVGAPRRARLIPQCLGQPGGVGALGVGVGLVAVADLLSEVLGQLADAPVRVFRSGEHALGVEPGHEITWIANVQVNGLIRSPVGRGASPDPSPPDATCFRSTGRSQR